jgi:hypothetical protein
MEFNKLLDKYETIRKELSDYVVKELTTILEDRYNCELEENEIVHNVYFEDEELWIDTDMGQMYFSDLNVDQQLDVYIEVKNSI